MACAVKNCPTCGRPQKRQSSALSVTWALAMLGAIIIAFGVRVFFP